MKTKRTQQITTAPRRRASAIGSAMLEWLLSNLHLIEVSVDASYCDKRKTPAVSFRSLIYHRAGRPWAVKGQSRKRLIEAIKKAMYE